MAENWIPYVRPTDHGPWACIVDVQHREAMPDAQRPLLIIAHITMRDAGPEGLGTVEEAGRLDDAFEAPLAKFAACNAVFVARSRAGGRMSFCIYAPAAAADKVEDLIRAAFPRDVLEFERRDDPQWQVYRDLLPTREEERHVLDAQVVTTLQEHGDPLTPKRDVRHFAYFRAEGQAVRFAQQGRDEGFKAEITPPDAEQPLFCVVLSRNDAVTLDEIVPITTMLSEWAEALGGEYDGWEAALVRPQRPGLFSRFFKQ